MSGGQARLKPAPGIFFVASKPILLPGFSSAAGSGEFDLEFATQGERGAFKQLQRDSGIVVGKKAVNGRARGFHAPGQRGAGDAAAFHFFRDLPGHDAFERTRLTLREQVFLREKFVEVRADVPFVHGIKVICATGSLPVPNLRAAASAIF